MARFNTMPASPLSGLRVLDLGTRIAAPFCAGLLGEQGAEVIKIEQPGTGDFMREIGPFVTPTQTHGAGGTQDGDNDGPGYSLFWAVEGRGRKSVTLDLRRPEGQDLFRRLAATADVVVENFRPGTLEQWHIGPTDLPPTLVIVRISSFGQDGPNARRPGLDRVGIGIGGLLHLTGYADRPPVRVGVTISDYLTGIFAAHAATAALYARDTRRDSRGDGGGAVIDASLYGAVLRILEWTLPAYDKLGVVRSREGNRLKNSAPLDNYPTADGKFVCIVAGSDVNFGRLCKAMSRPDVLDDPRFKRLADRAAHSDEVNGIVAEWTATLPATEVERRCVEHDVPVATAYTAADIFADSHIAARGDLVTVDDPVVGPLRQQAPFPRHAGEPPVVPSGAPRLGEHTREVLSGLLGLDDGDLDRLHEEGIV
jgi:crotonobetainyl-CoA:carnitine CoA-transferase CaiB-like acyl-CoA transferase